VDADELLIKQALLRLIGGLINVCEIALGSNRDLGNSFGFGEDVPLRLIAAEEAESVLRSFAASDRRILVEELLPSYHALSSYLARYAGDVKGKVKEDVENPDLVAAADNWKYTPSSLFGWLIAVDSRQSSDFSLDYAELTLDMADIVCRLDGHVSDREQFDIRSFALETLDDALKTAEITQDGDLDFSSRRWKRRRSSDVRRGEASANAADAELLDVLLTPRTASATATAKQRQATQCAGCGTVGVFESHYCDACFEQVPVVTLSSGYLEIEDSLDNGVQVAGPCDCDAAYLHCRRSGSRAWLDCHHCGTAHRIRLVRRHRTRAD